MISNSETSMEMKINRDALFSDTLCEYAVMENEAAAEDSEGKECRSVRLRLRVLKGNVERAYVVTPGGVEKKIPMEAAGSRGRFAWFEAVLRVGEEPFSYYFLAENSADSCIYTFFGPGAPGGKVEADACFRLMPGFTIPDWLQGAVIYQIFPDRFFNGDEKNDVRTGEYSYIGRQVRAVPWDTPVHAFDVHRFYGGDLEGIRRKLGYLKSLGVEVIYLNPIFVSPSNHKYDVQDYEHVDPHLTCIEKDGDYKVRSTDPVNMAASDQYFADFMDACRKAGLKVILDGVFNHCGAAGRLMDREGLYGHSGAYKNKESVSRDYFLFDEEEYEKWWGNKTLPKLNYESSEELRSYILDIAVKWVSPPYNADGWRLDVAADLGHSEHYNHQFWKEFRRRVKKAAPHSVILAEHYGDPSPWLQGDEWDTVMNYDAFMDPVTGYLCGMEKHSDRRDEHLYNNARAFFDAMRLEQSRLPSCSLMTAMNELSNHDHSRFLTRTNRKTGRLVENGTKSAGQGVRPGLLAAATVLQMTWPGAPTIYYGDEAGLCGWTDPDSRRPFPWGRENRFLQDFFSYAAAIHKKDVFRYGSFVELLAEGPVAAYGRMYKGTAAIVVINPSDRAVKADIPVWRAGIEDGETLERVIRTSETRYDVGRKKETIRNGILHCSLDAAASMIFLQP